MSIVGVCLDWIVLPSDIIVSDSLLDAQPIPTPKSAVISGRSQSMPPNIIIVGEPVSTKVPCCDITHGDFIVDAAKSISYSRSKVSVESCHDRWYVRFS